MQEKLAGRTPKALGSGHNLRCTKEQDVLQSRDNAVGSFGPFKPNEP